MESIKYFAMEDCAGDYFECSNLSATLSKTSCADMWRRARAEKDNLRLDKCRNCHVGAMHAGEYGISESPLAGKRICARCNKGAARFVGHDICVSCYNRQQEWVKGRNAKGTKPIKQRPLYPLTLPYLTSEKEVCVAKADMAESANEMIARVLRDSQKKVMFGFFKGAAFN